MLPLTEREKQAVIAAGCDEWIERPAFREGEADNIRQTLKDRSFRQFHPDLNASPRRGVTLDFFSGLKLYAQYGVDGRAVNEWELHAHEYRLEIGDSHDVVTLIPMEPRTYQQFPTQCSDCIDTTGVSISVRNAFNPSRIEFRINDPNSVLPPPFPHFGDWTTFQEDEIQQ